ncbi:thioredoxin family protein [Anaerococcus sp. NML200574]|uniref:thioredoxin family protein n=1 Tax=Anaerococcus sp. NML200574 TaxID=2954486 RepID=UPI0022370023|nr:thioredoxin family protein [Anaerococcus sp. NML200574]MCW6679048.1 thioredoxin family protein [Anaerococcus sp. NML200574]
MRLFGKKDKKEKDCTCGGNCKSSNNKDVKESSCCDVDYSSENIEKAEEKKKEKEIKILGSGCAKCIALERSTREALAELNVEESIDHITDFSQIASYGVMSTPALVIKGKVVSYGKVLNKDEVKALLEDNGVN